MFHHRNVVHSCVIDLAAYGLMDVRIYHVVKKDISLALSPSLLPKCNGRKGNTWSTLSPWRREGKVIPLTSSSSRRNRFLVEEAEGGDEGRRPAGNGYGKSFAIIQAASRGKLVRIVNGIILSRSTAWPLLPMSSGPACETRERKRRE